MLLFGDNECGQNCWATPRSAFVFPPPPLDLVRVLFRPHKDLGWREPCRGECGLQRQAEQRRAQKGLDELLTDNMFERFGLTTSRPAEQAAPLEARLGGSDRFGRGRLPEAPRARLGSVGPPSAPLGRPQDVRKASGTRQPTAQSCQTEGRRRSSSEAREGHGCMMRMHKSPTCRSPLFECRGSAI